MKQRMIALVLCISLVLTGCGWLDGSYSSVEIHREQRSTPRNDAVSASNRTELVKAMEQIISSGIQTAVIKVGQYPESILEQGVDSAVQYVVKSSPIGCYAVEGIETELGTSGGEAALAVNITYRRSTAEIQQIQTVANMNEAVAQVQRALDRCDASIVLLVEQYSQEDLTVVVENYAAANPQTVMEVPKVTQNVYGSTLARVLELSFSYQNSREDLKNMQSQVAPIFNAAVLYLTRNAQDHQKYSQLYAFLMERFDYKVETSLTPAYSLLHYGVGDSRAFAQVYGAMCRQAGLICMTVTGTRNGEPRTWNIVRENGVYYHVDLLESNAVGAYQTHLDPDMAGYVWDYSAYPVCDGTVIEENAE